MVNRLALALPAALAALLAAPLIGDAAAADSSNLLGQNLAGEICRATPRADLPKAARPPLELSCGTDSRRAGGITAEPAIAGMPASGEARRQAAERIARASGWAADLADRATCKPGTWIATAGAGEALVAACTLKAGGWPYLSVVEPVGDTVFLADGIPSLLPVIHAATQVSSQAGQVTPALSERASAELKSLGMGPEAIFASTDLTGYEDLTELARLFNSTENFGGAESAYRRALAAQDKALGATATGLGDTLMHLALEVSNQGRHEEAEALFRRAEPLVQRSVDRQDQARLVSYLALHAANARKYREALGLARDATLRRREIAAELEGPGGSGGLLDYGNTAQGEIAHSLFIEAAMSFRLDELAQAEAAAGEGLEIIDRTRSVPAWWRPQFLGLLGEIAAKQDKYALAQQRLTESLELRRQLFGTGWPVAAGYFSRGAFHSGQEEYASALEDYRAGLKIASAEDATPSDLSVDRLLPYMAATLGEAGRNPANRTALLGEMFRVAQLDRGLVAGQAAANIVNRLAQSDPRAIALIKEFQDARRARDLAQMELAAESAKPEDRRSKKALDSLSATANATATQTAGLEARLRETVPAFARIERPSPVDADAVGRQLEPGEGLLLFAIGRDGGYGMLVTRDGVEARRLAITDSQLAETVTELRRAFDLKGGQPQPYDLAVANKLYGQLIGPFQQLLAPVRSLTIVPSGALSSLPPALLVTETPKRGESYQNAAWWNRRLALSTAPSVRAFADLRMLRAKPLPPKPFIGFGDPLFTGTPAGSNAPNPLQTLAAQCREGAPVPPEFVRQLAPLPDTADELRQVGRRLGADPSAILLGASATEQAVRTAGLDQYRVIYFATHGLLPGELRCQGEPALALTVPPGTTGSADNDGLLDASEIARLRIDAELVVLSACNTAGGSGRLGGESLSGLAQAFFFAGARSMLVTHWQVPSAATARLTVDLFEKRGSGANAATANALRRAQLALAADPKTAHPFYWAAFTLVGDGGSIPSTLN